MPALTSDSSLNGMSWTADLFTATQWLQIDEHFGMPLGDSLKKDPLSSPSKGKLSLSQRLDTLEDRQPPLDEAKKQPLLNPKTDISSDDDSDTATIKRLKPFASILPRHLDEKKGNDTPVSSPAGGQRVLLPLPILDASAVTTPHTNSFLPETRSGGQSLIDTPHMQHLERLSGSNKSPAEEPEKEEGNRNVLVAGLGGSVDDAGLLALFEGFGPIESALVMLDVGTGRSRGFGFVMFERHEDAATACEVMHLKRVGDLRLRVMPSLHRKSVAGSETVFVRNLPRVVDETAVYALMGQYGSVRAVNLVEDHRGKPKAEGESTTVPTGGEMNEYWVATITFASTAEAKASISALHGKKGECTWALQGGMITLSLSLPLLVKFAEGREERKSRQHNLATAYVDQLRVRAAYERSKAKALQEQVVTEQTKQNTANPSLQGLQAHHASAHPNQAAPSAAAAQHHHHYLHSHSHLHATGYPHSPHPATWYPYPAGAHIHLHGHPHHLYPAPLASVGPAVPPATSSADPYAAYRVPHYPPRHHAPHPYPPYSSYPADAYGHSPYGPPLPAAPIHGYPRRTDIPQGAAGLHPGMGYTCCPYAA